MKFVFNRIF